MSIRGLWLKRKEFRLSAEMGTRTEKENEEMLKGNMKGCCKGPFTVHFY